jgi:hypothetical protein
MRTLALLTLTVGVVLGHAAGTVVVHRPRHNTGMRLVRCLARKRRILGRQSPALTSERYTPVQSPSLASYTTPSPRPISRQSDIPQRARRLHWRRSATNQHAIEVLSEPHRHEGAAAYLRSHRARA